MEFTSFCYSGCYLRWTSAIGGSGETIKKYCLLAKQPKQLIRIMKLTTVILLSTCLNVVAAGHAQKVTISLKNVPIQKVFEEVLLQANVTIIYDEAYFKDAKPISVKVKDALPSDVIKQCLSGLPFTFLQEGTSIFIEPLTVVLKSTAYPSLNPPPFPGSCAVRMDNRLRGLMWLLKERRKVL